MTDPAPDLAALREKARTLADAREHGTPSDVANAKRDLGSRCPLCLPGREEAAMKTCPRCKGKRNVPGKGIRDIVCPKCRGTGTVKAEKKQP